MVDGSGQVKLIDFGIARFFKPGKAKDTTLLGTPGYAPPEQHGHGQTDVRSDIFALGVTIYQLLTGYDPTTTPYSLPPVRTLAPAVSPAMEHIIQRAIQLRPQDRWQNIGEIQAVLKGKWTAQPSFQGMGVPAKGAGPASPAQPTPYVGAPAGIKRPTTRLIMAAATLSNEQLAAVLAALAVLVALGVWLLAPIIQRDAPLIWNNVPAFVIAGPLAHAALQRRWTAFLAHIAITVVGWAAWWTRSGDAPSSYVPFIVATALSGGVVELLMSYLPQIKRKGGADPWKYELGWYALGAFAAAVTFYLVFAGVYVALQPGMWIGSALLGALGWFLGDLVQLSCRLREAGSPAVLGGGSGDIVADGGRFYLRVPDQPAASVAPAATPPTAQPGLTLAVGYASHVGMVRELDEDSICVFTLAGVYKSVAEPTLGLFIVADGMGGHEGGEVASKMTVEIIARELIRRLLLRRFLGGFRGQGDAVPKLIAGVIVEANKKVHDLAQKRGSDMGSTVTLALVMDGVAHIANVGDSRTYLYRQGKLRQITADHSLVASLVKAGVLAPEEIFTHPDRNIIYRSIGAKPTVEVDTFQEPLAPGDTLLLCCDGLWEMIRDEGIEEVLLACPDPQAACAEMIRRANLAGGEDNISVIVVRVVG